MFHIIKGDIDNLAHTYENGYGSSHYIKVTNDVSSFNFISGVVSNGLVGSLITVAQIGNHVQTLESSCFYSCTALSGVKSSDQLRYLGDSCFQDCLNFQEFDALQQYGSLYTIGERCFQNTGFESPVLNLSSISYIGPYAFAGCTKLMNVSFLNVTYFSDYMFQGCTKLEYCSMGASVKGIGKYVFDGCTSLAAFKANNLTRLPEGFFNGCTELAYFESGSSLSKIEDYVFQGCTSLVALALPTSINSVDQISENAFAGSSLTCITFNGMPDSVFTENSGRNTKQYQTGTVYFQTGYESQLIDYAIQSNTPVVVMLNDYSKTNSAKNLDSIIASTQFTAEIASRPYYFVYADNYADYRYYDAVVSNSTIGSILSKGYTKDGTEIHIDKAKSLSKMVITYPCIIVIWNKNKTQADYTGVDSTGIYYVKIDGGSSNHPTKLNTSKGGFFGSRQLTDENAKELAIDSLASYLNSIFIYNYVGEETKQTTTTSLSRALTGWGLDHNCVFISSSGTQYNFPPTDEAYEKSSGIEIDTTTTTDFKFGKWYGNVVALANYVRNVNLSGFTGSYSKAADVPCAERVGLIIVATTSQRTSTGIDDYSMFYNYIFSSNEFQTQMKNSCCLLGYYDGDNWGTVRGQLGGSPISLNNKSFQAERPIVIYPKDGTFLFTSSEKKTTSTKVLTNNYFKYIYYSGGAIAEDSNKCTKKTTTTITDNISPSLILDEIPETVGGNKTVSLSDWKKAWLQQDHHPNYQP